MPRPRPWTDDQLRAAVAHASSLLAVCRALGVPPGGVTYAGIRRRIAELDLVTDIPAASGPRPQGRRSWTDDDLRAAVAASVSVAGVQRLLGFQPSGGMHRFIKANIKRLGLDTSHFTGQAWCRGRTGLRLAERTPLAELLVHGSTVRGGALRRRLIAEGVKEARCEWCGLSEWRGAPIQLELDHVNGDPTDNRLTNLRILCPNCHSMTETWCRSKRPGS